MDPRNLLKVFAEKATPNQLVAALERAGCKFFIGTQWCYNIAGKWILENGSEYPGGGSITAVDLAADKSNYEDLVDLVKHPEHVTASEPEQAEPEQAEPEQAEPDIKF